MSLAMTLRVKYGGDERPRECVEVIKPEAGSTEKYLE